MANRTLEIEYHQVLADLFNGINFVWVMRVLLVQGRGAGEWIVLTPHMGVLYVHLSGHRIVPSLRPADRQAETQGRDIGDERLFRNVLDSPDIRPLGLEVASERGEIQEIVCWPFGSSPKVAVEFLTFPRESGQDITSHHHDFVRRSEPSDASVVVHQRKSLSEKIRLALSFDQFELMIRSLTRLATAVSCNPKAPDFNGLDVMLAATTNEVRGAVVANFEGWVVGQQKNRFIFDATIMKQSRLHKEKRAALAKRKARKEGE